MIKPILEDGRLVRHHRMSEYVRALPTFTQWNLLMATKPSHASLDAQENVNFRCILCNTDWPSMEMSDITIGGIVRMQREDGAFDGEISAYVIDKGYKAVPVTRKGLGCPACFARYNVEVNAVAGHNQNVDELNTVRALLAEFRKQPTVEGPRNLAKCKHGMPTRMCAPCGRVKTEGTVESVAKRTPWINLFEDVQCHVCIDTLHVWSKELETYIRCVSEVHGQR